MKAIHPQWFSEAKVVCACGNTFTTGSTVAEIRVEVCSACHPFFTGQMRYVDTAGRVDKYNEKRQAAQNRVQTASKKDRRNQKRAQKIEEQLSRPGSLEEIRNNLSK